MFLKKIHGHSQGLVVKIFLGILCSSFGLWGIAEVVQKYLAYRPIAKVGKFEISYEELLHMLNEETNRIQQMYNGKIDKDLMRKLQLHTVVIERFINQKALIQLLGGFQLSVSDALVGDIIRSQPAFKKDGFYDATLLRDLLRSRGINEASFVNQMREDIMRHQLIGTLQSATALPKVVVDVITDALTVKHKFSAFTVPLSAISIDKTATDDDLKILFDENKDSYKTAEYRKAQVIIFDQNILIKNIKVTPEEVEDHYNNTRADYTQSERRMVRRVTYPNHAAAVSALEHLRKGRLITAVARDVAGGKYDDMGLVERVDLPENVRDIVFSIEVGKYSDPIENGTTYSVYTVTRIDPETVKTLNDVKAKVEEDVRLSKYPDYFQDLRNAVDDDLASGIKLSDVAAKHGLNIVTLSDVDQVGQTSNQSEVFKSLSDDAKQILLEQIFALEEGRESLITDISATQAFIAHLEKITPAAVPEFNSIKSTLKKDWERNQKRDSAIKLAISLTEKSKDLAELKSNIKSKGFSHLGSHAIRRIDIELKEFKDTESGKFFASLTPHLSQKLFTLTVGKSTFDITSDDKVILLVLDNTESDTMDKTTIEKIKESIQKMTQNDIESLLTLTARNRIDVKINEELMKLAARGLADGD